MDLVGKILSNRYEILEKIGEGGMAIVYKARCNLLNRYVAVKVLKNEFASDETFVKRFRAEAQSAASLTHSNIVSVYDVGFEDGISFIVMELLETKTLKDYIEENGAMDSELVLKIAAQIASALETAHKSHIIHRDIKPQNIILNKNMVAKVTDFGIAKVTNVSAATITTSATTMGSVHYFSPEQAKGGYTDEKSDLYSLGIVMYEMATGRLPFDAESAVSVALKHIQERAVDPIVANPNISPALNQIILKAMEKSTTFRYQNATELLRDISEALLQPNKLIVRPESTVEAGATQVIPIIDIDDEVENVGVTPEKVPNLRTKESTSNRRVASVVRPDEIDTPSRSRNKDEDLDAKKRKKIILIVCIVIFVLIIAMVSFFGFKISSKLKEEAKANAEIEIPNVVGRDYEEAKAEYEKQGIEILQDSEEYSSEYKEGFIISQTPEKATKTKDKKMYVVVSKGERLVEVTDVTGKDLQVAKYELEETLGFKVETEEVINEKVAAGLVISQDIEAGESVAYGSTIKLTVSQGDGKATVIMPSVIGKTEEAAKKTLTALGLTVNVKTDEDSNKSNGVVIEQSYPQNQELKEGTLVDITINKLLITKNVSLDLLELQGGTPLTDVEEIEVKVTASIDGGAANTVFEKTFPTTEKTASFSVNGYSEAVLKIYLNGNLTKEQTIEFK